MKNYILAMYRPPDNVHKTASKIPVKHTTEYTNHLQLNVKGILGVKVLFYKKSLKITKG